MTALLNPEVASPPLAGFTVAVTAERRRDELTALLERRGARVVSAPAISIVPLPDDAALHAATAACVTLPPDLVVSTTGIGFRGWLEAAEGWGLGEALRSVLGGARLIARGPKARGAIRAAGLADAWHAESECCEEVLSYLLDEGVAGQRVAVQLHGEPQENFVAALREAGADVVEVPVYRWVLPEDVAPLRRLVDLVLARQVDAVTFTSAAAVGALLTVAGPEAPSILTSFGAGHRPGVILDHEAALAAAAALPANGRDPSPAIAGSALSDPSDRAAMDEATVLAACVGPVTAARLRAAGVPALLPERARLGSLVKAVVDELPRRARRLHIGGHLLELRGHAVVVDGRLRTLAPAPMAVLRALADRPGKVMSRAELLAALPRGADGHAVEMAVARLRAGLGSAWYVQTVIKRGYRLRVD